jgi:hypothetical protein
MQEALQELDHAPAARLLHVHGLADQFQLFSLPGTQIPSAACDTEQAQQVVAASANLPRGAIREIQDHRVRKHLGFERPDAFFKSHSSAPVSGLASARGRSLQLKRNTSGMFQVTVLRLLSLAQLGDTGHARKTHKTWLGEYVFVNVLCDPQ